MDHLNLCTILSEEMRKLQFSDKALSLVESSPLFVRAQTEPATVQRTMLTMLLNRIFTMGPFVVPAEIRLSLTMATDTLGWSDDLKLVLLPFLNTNEDHFFG